MSGVAIFGATFLFLSVPFIIAFVIYYLKWKSASKASSTPCIATPSPATVCPTCGTSAPCPAPTVCPVCNATTLTTRGYTPAQIGNDYPGNDLGAFATPDPASCLYAASQNPKATGVLYWPVGSAPAASGLCYPKNTNVSAKNPNPLTGIMSWWFTS